MNRLVAVHAPVATLGDLIVISVELWTEAVFVHLARTDTEMDRRWAEYADAASAARGSGTEPPEPPDALIGRDVRLADDLGTRYEPRSAASGGAPERPLRGLWRFEPGVPPTATRLTVAIGDQALELAL